MTRFSAAVLAVVVINAILWPMLGASGDMLTRAGFEAKKATDPLFATMTWWMAKAYLEEPREPDVILMGSSQMNAASWGGDVYATHNPVDCVLHRRVTNLERRLPQGMTVLNCAVQGAMASDYFMIARALFQGKNKPKVVVLGISPRDFIDNKLAAASATEPFRFFSEYVDTGVLGKIAFPDPHERLMAEMEWTMNRSPLRRLHALLDQRLLSWQGKEQKSSAVNEALLALAGSPAAIMPGQLVVKDNMANVWVDNSAEYKKRYENSNPPSYPIQMAFFNEFLSYMNQLDVPVVVVGMPTLSVNYDLLPEAFWTSYRSQVSDACSTHHARWLDLSQSDQFAKADFIDTVHVNDKGGDKLMQRFAEAIAGFGQIANSRSERRFRKEL